MEIEDLKAWRGTVPGFEGEVFAPKTTLKSIVQLPRTAAEECVPTGNAVLLIAVLSIPDLPDSVYRAFWLTHYQLDVMAEEQFSKVPKLNTWDLNKLYMFFYQETQSTAFALASETGARLLVIDPPPAYDGCWQNTLSYVAMLADNVAHLTAADNRRPAVRTAIPQCTSGRFDYGLCTPYQISKFFSTLDRVCPGARETLRLSIALDTVNMSAAGFTPVQFLEQLDCDVPIGAVLLHDSNGHFHSPKLRVRPIGRGVIGKDGFKNLWKYMRKHHSRFRGVPIFNLDAQTTVGIRFVDESRAAAVIDSFNENAKDPNTYVNYDKAASWLQRIGLIPN